MAQNILGDKEDVEKLTGDVINEVINNALEGYTPKEKRLIRNIIGYLYDSDNNRVPPMLARQKAIAKRNKVMKKLSKKKDKLETLEDLQRFVVKEVQKVSFDKAEQNVIVIEVFSRLKELENKFS
ncbi:hypothetical protein [Desulfolucanica intricata]|uniref:hypothetical protein n=1 Tax=Desulfolucanica intricata TaxID=1285191 RepID=UPI0008300B1C|nr:hypothetical protein [Desulfolucanica intricata]